MCLFAFDIENMPALPLLTAIMNWPSIYFFKLFLSCTLDGAQVKK